MIRNERHKLISIVSLKMNSQIMSIYIPRMCVNTCEHEIRMVFNAQEIGFVRRIDFCPIDKKPGFVENTDSHVKSAFVHFHCLNNTQLVADIQATLSRGEGYRLNVNGRNASNGYWILLKATNPVQDTMMNSHQIVDNCKHLEKRIEEQANEIKELNESIQNIKDCLYQFFGGLYCQQTQGHMIDNHSAVIEGEPFDATESKRNNPLSHKWGGWPTTRQGDDCERRLDEIEYIMVSRGWKLANESQESHRE